MNWLLLVQCLTMFLGGQAVHLFLIKMPAIKKRSASANRPFYFGEWMSEDRYAIIGTQAIGIVAFIGLDELPPYVMEYVKWFFCLIGAFGSTVVMSKWSQFEQKVLSLADIKANIADATTGRTTSRQEAIEKGNVATGIDVTIPPPSTK